MYNFSDKICLVTGGTNGIGKRVSELLIEYQANVIIFGRNSTKGISLMNELGKNCYFIPCDISDPIDVKKAFDIIKSRYGRLDCAFNNAGITANYGTIIDSDINDWINVMNTNVNGTYYCMKYELQLMQMNSTGSIVNSSSCVGILPTGGQAAYATSKQAINAITQISSIENAKLNNGGSIRINSVAPGPILGGMNSSEKLNAAPKNTERKINATAMKRFGSLDEIAKSVIWLLSEHSSYITGAILPVDGGYSSGKF
ncbi:TPA: SDR family NAD(P)-dependent oxidoreductase [Providencia alcalifaciens]